MIGIYLSSGPINPCDFIRYLLIYSACLGPPVQIAGDAACYTPNDALLIKYIDTKAERSYFITCRAIHLCCKLQESERERVSSPPVIQVKLFEFSACFRRSFFIKYARINREIVF